MNNFSKIGFVLATLGSSIGLGHIWRFPYMAGENGGGAFVIFYLILAVLIGASMLMAEMLLGNKARSNPLDNFTILNNLDKSHLNNTAPNVPAQDHNTTDSKSGSSLMWLGFSTIAAPLILSFYAVVMGWIMYYLFFVSFHLPTDINEANMIFNEITSHSLLWQGMCFFRFSYFFIFNACGYAYYFNIHRLEDKPKSFASLDTLSTAMAFCRVAVDTSRYCTCNYYYYLSLKVF